MIKKFHIYVADLEPSFGAEPGKLRPVVVVQADALNEAHFTTIVCSLTTNIKKVPFLRVHVPATSLSGLSKDSDVMIDQVRSIDIRRLKKHLGRLNEVQSLEVIKSLSVLINE